MPSKTVIFIGIALTAGLQAAPRPWKSEDGQRSIQGEFVKRDATTITVRRNDTKEVVLPIEKLHPDDRTWVNVNHPVAGAKVPDASAVFDELSFGDNRDAVFTKLKASKFVELTTDETFIGRSGLNGVFRTRQKIGGQHAMLYFDWTGDNQLKEITLQTDGLPAAEVTTQLIPCWKSFVGLLTTLHGKPIVADNQFHQSSIQDGSFSPTHLWKLETSGSAQLGAARDGDKFQVVVRFTKQEIKPVVVP